MQSREARTVFVIEDDFQIVQAMGLRVTDKPQCWYIPALGYTNCGVFFDPYDAMAEQTKRIEVEQGRLNRILFNPDGSPKGALHRVRVVRDQHSKTLRTDDSSPHEPVIP